MDRLEEQLRSVLTDDRLDVRMLPGAVQAVHDGVRRRKRRNATVCAAAAVALVIGGVAIGVGDGPGGHASVVPGDDDRSPSPSPTSPKPTSTTLGGHGTARIDWNPLPPTAVVITGAVADQSVPWCDGRGLTVTAGEFQSATGSAAGGLTVTNTGTACALQGPPAVTGLDAHGEGIAEARASDDFLARPWFVLHPGQRALAGVQITADAARCLGPVTALAVDLGHGGPLARVDITAAGGRDVVPRCGTLPPGQRADHYDVVSDDWRRPDGTPTLPTSDLSVSIRHAPRVVLQGAIISYQVLMTGTAPVDPCLPFREKVTWGAGGPDQTVVQDHLLDCAAMKRAGPVSGYLLDMRLALPSRVPAGDVTLSWETPLPGQSAIGPVIHVNGVPAACDPAHLSVTGDGMDGAAGAYYGRVVFTNRAARACSLRGYPGVQFTDAGGDPLPTKARDPGNHRINSPGEMAFDTVILRAHGGTASFVVSGSDWMPPDGSTPCPTTKGLLVIAPGGFLSDQVLVTGVADDCNHEYIRVWPVVAGRHALAH
ncbi:MAG TPA: DUF4232 domain-containing protein [Mycobacteriales bacterium]|nr:DUF4232 domain-containing protein [Mycobacteriales bacterium]